MMQPLGVQYRTAFAPALLGSAPTAGTIPTFSAAKPQQASSFDTTQNSAISLGPILLELMASIVMIMQQMLGQQGTSGTAGTAGLLGSTGDAGTAGLLGNAGTAGTAGTPGLLGSAGTAGTIGTAGLLGSAGTDDMAGIAGILGNAGTTGSTGYGDVTLTPPVTPVLTPPGGIVTPPVTPPVKPPVTPPVEDPNAILTPSLITPLTNLPGGAQGTGQALGESVNQIRGQDYTKLTEDQRSQFNGLSRDSAAIIHLGGRANISGALTANGVSPSAQIYNNVLQSPANFKPEEQALVKKWSQQEIAQHGMITGENLDHAFIDEMGSRNGIDAQHLQQYHTAVDQRVSKMLANPNQAAVIADSKKPLHLVDDIATLQSQSGLNQIEQAAFRLAGHSVLFSGDGTVNGDILPITLGNTSALDNKGANNGTIDQETKALLDADVADNGKIDGSSLRAADKSVLDKLYVGGKGISNNQQVVNQGIQTGISKGRTMQAIQKSILNGSQQALNDFKNLAKNHSPAMLAAGATMAGAAAVCPFLGGMAAGAAGIGVANKLLNPASKN